MSIELIDAINELRTSVETLTESVRDLNGTHIDIQRSDNTHDNMQALSSKISELVKVNEKLIISIAGLRFG